MHVQGTLDIGLLLLINNIDLEIIPIWYQDIRNSIDVLFYFLFSYILELCSRILPLFARVLVELEGGDSLLILFILAMNGHLLRIDLMYVTLLSTADGGRRPYVISLGLAQESFYWQTRWELSPAVPILPSPFLCSWCWKISLWNTMDGYLDILEAVLLLSIKCEGYLVAGEVRREHCWSTLRFQVYFQYSSC